ncbi:MAG TPA: S8 family serine peptidase, partial [Steroidobacteraceae bacterium]|nr:S8 family serine peptidase [Steroidobacteraceae bacterium]
MLSACRAPEPFPPSGEQNPAESPPVSSSPQIVEGEWLVKFKQATPVSTIKSVLKFASLSDHGSYRSVPGLHRVKVAPGGDAQIAKSLLEQRVDIEYIEPNFIVHEAAIPNDPKFDHLWGLKSPAWFGGVPGADIGALEAWDVTIGSADVVIAVIDSGIDYTHEDLAANIYTNTAECDNDGVDDDNNGYVDDCHGIDTANDDSDPMDDRDHGTHVAGTIGAVGNNGVGVVGVAWNVRMLPCKFLDETGNGTTAAAIECLDYLAMLRDRGVNIVASNNSWGGGGPSRALDEAVVAQRQRNILTIAAAGNYMVDVDKEPGYPCSIDSSNVICVGSSSLDDSRDFYTNWGVRTLAVQAPGASIWSTVPGNKYDAKDGTSMATPHVSGVVALLASQNPSRDWRALKNLIIASADPYVGNYPQFNAPHLNAAAALNCTNASARKRLKPVFVSMSRPVGGKVVFTAQNIRCDAPAGALNVTVAQTGEIVPLRDDGFDNDEVAGDGVYSGAWTTSAVGDFTLTLDGIPTEPIAVKVEGQLKPGFPLQMSITDDDICNYGGGDFGITVGNVVGDPYPEVFATGSLMGPVFGWNHVGVPLVGWPIYDSCQPTMLGIGELDGDLSDGEIAAVVAARMIHYTHTGMSAAGWPRMQQQAYFPPAIADLDGDGRDELIGYPSRYADGVAIPNLMPTTQGLGSTAAIADLDSDGRPEVVIAEEARLWAANLNGSLFGFPTSALIAKGIGWVDEAVVGDVDGDGEPEIVFSKHLSNSYGGRLVVHSSKGAFERLLPINDWTIGKPVLADMDQDGIPEILVTTYRAVHAFKGDGTYVPGWPLELPSTESYPSYLVVGDVMGTGHPNVVFSVGTAQYHFESGVLKGRLYIVHADGTLATGFPRDVDISRGTLTSAIADLDLDGRNELLFTSAPDYGFRDNVYAYDFSNGPTGPIEWGQYRGGADHRGFYSLGKNLPNEAYLTAHPHGGGTISTTDGRINCAADCIERYTKGASVVLTATPGPGAQFEQWVGDCAGQGNPCTLTLQRYMAATARFHTPLNAQIIGSGSGTIVSTPGGIDCPTDCVEAYPGDSVVTLVATPTPGSDFDGWSGACSGFELQCRVRIDAAYTVTAKFVTSRRVTVTKSGLGAGRVVSTPEGVDCGSTCSADFAPDSTVKLTAQPASGSYFWKWTGACEHAGRECSVNADAERSVVALFGISPVLTVKHAGNGTGTIRGSDIDCGLRCSFEGQYPMTSVVLVGSP